MCQNNYNTKKKVIIRGVNQMKKLHGYIKSFEKRFTRISLLLVIILVFISAVLRGVGYPLNWTVDLAQMLFAWTIFLGADIALRDNNLVKIDFIISLLSSKWKKRLNIFLYIFTSIA